MHFTDLPHEIVVKVLQHAAHDPKHRRPKASHIINMLYTCRTLYCEYRYIFYWYALLVQNKDNLSTFSVSPILKHLRHLKIQDSHRQLYHGRYRQEIGKVLNVRLNHLVHLEIRSNSCLSLCLLLQCSLPFLKCFFWTLDEKPVWIECKAVISDIKQRKPQFKLNNLKLYSLPHLHFPGWIAQDQTELANMLYSDHVEPPSKRDYLVHSSKSTNVLFGIMIYLLLDLFRDSVEVVMLGHIDSCLFFNTVSPQLKYNFEFPRLNNWMCDGSSIRLVKYWLGRLRWSNFSPGKADPLVIVILDTFSGIFFACAGEEHNDTTVLTTSSAQMESLMKMYCVMFARRRSDSVARG